MPDRAEPRFVPAGAAVAVSTRQCLISGVLTANANNASVAFHDCTGAGDITPQNHKAHLGTLAETSTPLLDTFLSFNTGCVVSCNGAQAYVTVYLKEHT